MKTISFLLTMTYAAVCLSITALYEPILNYGYFFSRSISVLLASEKDDLIKADEAFAKQYFAPILKEYKIKTENIRIIDENYIRMTLQIKRYPKIGFLNEENYINIKNQVDCVFMYSTLNAFIAKLPDANLFMNKSQAMEAAENLLMTHPERKYAELFFSRGCDKFITKKAPVGPTNFSNQAAGL